MIRPYGPASSSGIAKTVHNWGIGFAGGIGALAIRAPHDVALIDELGELTWAELDDRATRLAHGLKDLGVGSGESVAVLCRNHRYFVEASTALSKLGSDILYLNTAFSPPQLGEVCEREKPVAIIYDDEFTEMVDKSGIDLHRVIAWHDGERCGGPAGRGPDREGGDRPPPRPRAHHPPGDPDVGHDRHPQGRSPWGVRHRRRRGPALEDAAEDGRDVPHLRPAVPHLGWAHLNMAMLLGSTMVLRRKFDPADCLETVRSTSATP